MGSILIMYAADDRPLLDQIVDAAGKAFLDRTVSTFDATRDNAYQRPDDQLLKDAAAADCVVLIWSQGLAGAVRAQVAVHASIHAWSRDRFVMGSPDQAELPHGLRDLASQPLKAAMALEAANPAGSGRSSDEDVQYLIGLVAARLAEEDRADAAAAAEQCRHMSSIGHRRRLLVIAVVVVVLMGAAAMALSNHGIPYSSTAHRIQSYDEWLRRHGYQGQTPDDQSLKHTVRTWSPGILEVGLGAGIAVLVGGVVWARARRRYKHQQDERLRVEHELRGVRARDAFSEPDHHVFVSYSHRDADEVKRVVKQIEDAGYRVWIDANIAGAAQRYGGQIVRAIRSSKVVALMGSRNSFGSDHVVREVYVAGDLKKAFVVVQLDDADIPDELLYFITGFPRVKANERAPDHIRKEIARFVAA